MATSNDYVTKVRNYIFATDDLEKIDKMIEQVQLGSDPTSLSVDVSFTVGPDVLGSAAVNNHIAEVLESNLEQFLKDTRAKLLETVETFKTEAEAALVEVSDRIKPNPPGVKTPLPPTVEPLAAGAQADLPQGKGGKP